MGKRGEIFSSRLQRDRRTYFFNVHENFTKSYSLSIVESKNSPDNSSFQRQSILVFQEDLDDFLREMQKAIDVIRIEKSKNDRNDYSHKSGREIVIKAVNKKEVNPKKRELPKKPVQKKKMVMMRKRKSE